METGWKTIPLSLKILFVVLIFWIMGSIMAVPMRFEQGLPFFGIFLYGAFASVVILALDIVAPITFLYSIWTKQPWGAKLAYAYMSIFILNSLVALLTHREELGLFPILIPALVTLVFLLIVYSKRSHFQQ